MTIITFLIIASVTFLLLMTWSMCVAASCEVSDGHDPWRGWVA